MSQRLIMQIRPCESPPAWIGKSELTSLIHHAWAPVINQEKIRCINNKKISSWQTLKHTCVRGENFLHDGIFSTAEFEILTDIRDHGSFFVSAMNLNRTCGTRTSWQAEKKADVKSKDKEKYLLTSFASRWYDYLDDKVMPWEFTTLC